MSTAHSEPTPDQPPESAATTPAQPASPATESAPGVLSLVQSVAAAAFGVQSEKKRQQDFQHGKPGDYIALGVIFVIAFIITLIVIVNIVLGSAGK